MTLDQFINKLVQISLEAPTQEMRDAALTLYVEVARCMFEDHIEDAENFVKLFSK
jgi:hypothetical protein